MKRTGELKRKTPLKARKPLSSTKRASVRHKPAKRQRVSDKRFRSEEYLAFVRTLPCCVCGATTGIAAHHIIGLGYGLSGMGLTAPDSYAMPLCRYHHGEVHKHPLLQQAQPTWLRWTLRKGLEEFTGEVAEQLLHALAFIEAREAPRPAKRCPHNDCGWCYAPPEVENNAVHEQCREPRACPALIEATEVGQ